MGPRIRIFCSDLDGTLLGNPEAAKRFGIIWKSIPPSGRPMLCYASGRLVTDILDLLDDDLIPWPDYIIGGVGTQVYDAGKREMLQEYEKTMNGSWDPAKVEAILAVVPGAGRQPARLEHRLKSSWYLRQASAATLDRIRRSLREAGLDVTVVYSSARDLDILPSQACKGFALEWLSARLAISLDRVLVAGDTGNDSSMFLLPGVRRIMVGNARAELREASVNLPLYAAAADFADGVIEGLRHFHAIAQTPRSGQRTA